MKQYVAPQILCMEIRSEERIANAVMCMVGSCMDDFGNDVWQEPTGS